MSIPLLKPSCTQAEIDAVTEVLKSGWWGQGPKCEEFEIALAKRYGRKHCVTLNSATAALHLALKVSGIGPGDGVIVPALTFISTALAVSYCGARPVFCDVRPDSLTLDYKAAVEIVLSNPGRRFAAIIPVDYAGYPAHAHSSDWVHYFPHTPMVQDAAHAAGGTTYGDMTCLSFHPVKNLAMGDGGAILLDSDEQDERLRALRWCGINRSTYERTEKRYGWDYDIAEVGYKCHLNDIQAAVGLAQLQRLDDLNARRRQIAATYTAELRGRDIELPDDHPDHTWHLYPIRVDAKRRNVVIDHLLANEVSAGVHYKPLTHYQMYADQPTPPVTEREWQRLVSLPIFYDLTEDEQAKVIALVKEVC